MTQLVGLNVRHKSKKEGKDQEQYDQVPHLNQDTNGKVTDSQ